MRTKTALSTLECTSLSTLRRCLRCGDTYSRVIEWMMVAATGKGHHNVMFLFTTSHRALGQHPPREEQRN